MDGSNLSRIFKRNRNRRAQSIIEVLVGSIVLVPIVLAIIDLAVVYIGGDICNDLAKQAARAAANASDITEATTAVADVQTNFNKSATYENLTLNLVQYDGTHDGLANVRCTVTIVLPVPIPFLSLGPKMTINTQASEAIVGIAPPRPS
ncbi:hypothetical protein BH11CYA1_BH11CYA1_48160 [soil metagenome]